MNNLIAFVNTFLNEIFNRYDSNAFYIEADQDQALPYGVFESMSDSTNTNRTREDFIFTVTIYGTFEDMFKLDSISEDIKQGILNGNIKQYCAPFTAAFDYAGRNDVPSQDPFIKVKEVRFKARYYNI
ncbi:hypothetical protein CON48_12205 [Bacillus thuringiensis]|uniref:Uncharacterized protein n=1 Tax=Bacillus thuringiensis TaxID=1428 RepID=A0A9X6XQ58_BACTU|nr:MULTISPECIES: hypothetical protein [Bacillus]MEC2946021.1 hypothetical protein [Bacillus cereus]MEC3175747.1 hypothetical protein [Bacillus cereus]PDY72538.1 hypothetical protein COM88_01925 [Bacillus cereus]PDY97587.1 hypothetical protein CON12_24095 [Bacillus thuringiensis]PEA50025.1 hypothetical protein CON48_12205 [Bacillus thuringiensis]